jgi:hypothetical protein
VTLILDIFYVNGFDLLLTSSELQTEKNLFSEEDIFGISHLSSSSSSSSSIYFGTMTNDLTGKERRLEL